MGARGWARVIDIMPCGPVETGPGDMITGTFRHSHGLLGDLVLESESQPIAVTSGHLFWSVDRQAWVPVGNLRRAERLHTLNGVTRVVSYTMSDRVEPVYNLEVEDSHCYRVGESGVLVHNASVPLQKCSMLPAEKHARDYQIRACGPQEYYVMGNNTRKCADAVEGEVVIDCKALVNPQSSPQIGTAPAWFVQTYTLDQLQALRVYEQIIKDPCSGFTKLVVRVEDSRQVPFWKNLLGMLTIATGVEVVP